ncbi:MAG: hypothetical protein J6N76_02630, partial [Lachnospiraceae bacterium]|nr:hypothetical protein [Lachnospiraceae bacterium]
MGEITDTDEIIRSVREEIQSRGLVRTVEPFEVRTGTEPEGLSAQETIRTIMENEVVNIPPIYGSGLKTIIKRIIAGAVGFLLQPLVLQQTEYDTAVRKHLNE